MKHRWVWALALVGIGVIIGGAWIVHRRSTAAAALLAAGKSLHVVQRDTLTQTVDSSGRVVPNLEVEIKCRASGEIVALPFDVSQQVKKGDLLLELDPADQQRAVTRSEITMAQSQARLAEAQASLHVAEREIVTSRQRAQADLTSAQAKAREERLRADRRKQLVEQQLGSSEDYEAAESLATQAEAAVETAKAQLAEVDIQEAALETSRQQVELAKAQLESDRVFLADARQQLQYTRVTAPIDGVVSARSVQIGTIISSGITNVGGGTTIMTLADLSRLFILASVDESDIGRVAVGQSVNITVDAFPGETFDGVVRRIAIKGVNVSNVVTFEVKIEVTGDNRSKLKPEMTANVQILTSQRKNVLLVPLAAVWRDGEQSVVTLRMPDGSDKTQPVKLGITDGENVEILDGLSEAQTVVVQANQIASRWSSDQQSPTAATSQPRGAPTTAPGDAR